MSPRPVHTSSWLWSFRSTVFQGQLIRNWNTPPELFIHFRYDYARNWENPTDLYIHFGYEYDCQSQLIRNWENPTQLFIHFGYDYVRNLESPMELFIRFSYVYVRAKWQAQENIIPLHYNELSVKVCFTNFKNRSINNCWQINTSKRNPDKNITRQEKGLFSCKNYFHESLSTSRILFWVVSLFIYCKSHHLWDRYF